MIDHRAMRWLLPLVMVVVVACLIACSNDTEPDEVPQPQPTPTTTATSTIKLVPCVPTWLEVRPVSSGTTRGEGGWTPPTGYVSYAENSQLQLLQKDLIDNTIAVFFTRDGKEPFSRCFEYYDPQTDPDAENPDDDPYWRPILEEGEKDFKVESGKPYHLYGYIPYEATAAITESNLNYFIVGSNDSYQGTYSDGAILTLKGLDAVTPSDVCVVVGAKDGESLEKDNGLLQGKFDFSAQGSKGPNHYVFLLFDHIYAAMQFCFKVGEDYDKLRTIRIREVKIEAEGSFFGKYDAKITLQKTSNQESPIQSIVFDNGTSSSEPVPLYDWGFKEGDEDYNDNVNSMEKGLILKTEASNFMCSFRPGGFTNEFTLQSTYDVFDKKGNLIRKACTAKNKITLTGEKGLFGNISIQRGHMYSITLTVEPTYLYVLSDPDVDNPTVNIE